MKESVLEFCKKRELFKLSIGIPQKIFFELLNETLQKVWKKKINKNTERMRYTNYYANFSKITFE